MATENNIISNYDKYLFKDAKNYKIGIVVSDWNSNITQNLLKGALDTLLDCGVIEKNIFVKHVPGSFELIFGAKKMQSQGLNSVIAIGCIIKGETKHFDYVCQGATNGIAQVGLRYNKPVTFCVLTDQNEQQSIDRSGGKHGNKGIECAISCLKMIQLKDEVKKPSSNIGF